MTKRIARIALGLVLLLAGLAHAGEDVGRTLYLRYCASCHGRSGSGDGPVAPALGEKPTDLTQIAARHGGTFPFVDVCEAIDGTRSVRAHGVSEMPVWGEIFDSDSTSPLEQQIVAGGKVMTIARYLRTLQAPTPPAH
jgi:mono/diheme cytochrome c family protein